MPMEVDAVTWEGYGKGKNGKDGYNYKGKGEANLRGKGKTEFTMEQCPKGQEQGERFFQRKVERWWRRQSLYGKQQKLDRYQCLYCHCYGHRKFPARKFLADKAAGNVRQINEDSASTAAGTRALVHRQCLHLQEFQRLVQQLVRAVAARMSGRSQVSLRLCRTWRRLRKMLMLWALAFHVLAWWNKLIHLIWWLKVTMSACWTYAPDLLQGEHIRSVSNFREGETVEVLVDSGADASVLPLSCGDVGHSMAIDKSTHFVDAQGARLAVTAKRVAELTLGNDIVIKEQFIVAPVTGPIFCLVNLLKAGWDFQRIDGVSHVCKDGHGFPLCYRKNSLYTESVISKVSELDSSEKSMVVESMSAIKLTGLTNLSPGWNKPNDDVWALRANSPCSLDTTLSAETLIWLRTTLVKDLHGWEVLEFAQPISELKKLFQVEIQSFAWSPLLMVTQSQLNFLAFRWMMVWCLAISFGIRE